MEKRRVVAATGEFQDLPGGFGFDDQVSFTELRHSKGLERLREAGQLRLVLRNESIGVIVSVEVWREIEPAARRDRYEAALREVLAQLAILASRTPGRPLHERM